MSWFHILKSEIPWCYNCRALAQKIIVCMGVARLLCGGSSIATLTSAQLLAAVLPSELDSWRVVAAGQEPSSDSRATNSSCAKSRMACYGFATVTSVLLPAGLGHQQLLLSSCYFPAVKATVQKSGWHGYGISTLLSALALLGHCLQSWSPGWCYNHGSSAAQFWRQRGSKCGNSATLIK